MAEIELVVKISEETYKILKNYTAPMPWAEHLIKKGTPLPKGHGKLVDIDLLRDQVSHDEREVFSKHQVWLLLSAHNKKIPTIIEADKPESEDEE